MQLPSVLSLAEVCLGFPPMQDHLSFLGWLCVNDANRHLIAYYSVHLNLSSCFVKTDFLFVDSISWAQKQGCIFAQMAQIASCEVCLDLGRQLPGFQTPKRLSWTQLSFVCDQQVLGISQAGWSGEVFLILTLPSIPELWGALWSGRWPSLWKIKQNQPLFFLC